MPPPLLKKWLLSPKYYWKKFHFLFPQLVLPPKFPISPPTPETSEAVSQISESISILFDWNKLENIMFAKYDLFKFQKFLKSKLLGLLV